MLVRDHQTPNFRHPADLENLLLGHVNPADDLGFLRDKYDVIVALKNAREAAFHCDGGSRIAQLPAQASDGGGVRGGCFLNLRVAHWTNLGFFAAVFYNSVRRNAR